MTGETWTGHLRMFKDSDVLEFEVQMLEIPIVDGKGKEVVVTFKAMDFNNTEEFYTDSNGLEMQYRKLNWRPDGYKVKSNQTITSNYYPINSAIAIRDSARNAQFTVMNDRSQGGSSLNNGEVELMQNRRLLYDDRRGVDEALNETDDNGYGLAVSATYRIQFSHYANQTSNHTSNHTSNSTHVMSAQRRVQMLVDEPLQYFFAMNQSFSNQTQNNTVVSQSHENYSANNGTVKVHLFPEAKNQILLRVENMADLFDGSIMDQLEYFSVHDYALNLWYQMNWGKAILNGVRIVERTLGNSEDMATMRSEKIKWQTETPIFGDEPVEPYYPSDRPNYEVALQPQRIRLFRITYDPLVNQEMSYSSHESEFTQ